MKLKKPAFTLPEIMITLTVIGVLTAILLPVAMQSKPDENLMKFKKAHATLYKVMNKLITSDQYYKDGDLGVKPDGSYVSDGSYFCKTFVDVISTKSELCETYQKTFINGKHNLACRSIRSMADNYCIATAPSVKNEIVTSDNIVYYETSPAYTFAGVFWSTPQSRWAVDNIVSGASQTSLGPNLKGKYSFMYITWDGNEEHRTPEYMNEDNTNFYYMAKILCVDVDGIPDDATATDCVNECPFGYGVTVEGKILPGARAEEWLDKNMSGDD